jgi:hypothetical protein
MIRWCPLGPQLPSPLAFDKTYEDAATGTSETTQRERAGHVLVPSKQTSRESNTIDKAPINWVTLNEPSPKVPAQRMTLASSGGPFPEDGGRCHARTIP